MKQILGVIDKKLRNLEKKKGKLDDYQERMNKGERFNQDQLDAVSKYQEVTNNLEFEKELQRSFMALSQDIQKTIEKTARQEQLMREEAEQKCLKTVLEVQYVLDKLGDDEVRTDLKQGLTGVPILPEEEFSLLDEFYMLVDPERDMSLRLNGQYEHASIHLWDLLEGKEKSVCGTTYKALKEITERVFQSNYFDSTHNHQNGLCEEEEAASAPTVEDQVAEAEPEPAEEYTEQSEVQSTEYVNRQFMAETQFSSGEKEQNTGFTRSSQPYYNSHGVSRGGSCGARGLMNGYRGPPANGFRGGYDGYHSSFSNTPNSDYTQSQFSAPRDYSGYQWDGYQQNFKRGSEQSGPWGAPRGHGGPPRPNRGMLQMNTQQVN
ncbi:Caprin-1 [Heterocephalus glaber]|uniref:Caprin-1 n=1 Tax=Heterocephalus glaber TaxID=10181 RepID=G5AP77_HETGA|nr:Caprin-1 [Heterocephalus glaber]